MCAHRSIIQVAIKPYQGPYKVYIIPEADIMTVQAQNALLKTIEEPPQYAVFNSADGKCRRIASDN